MVTTYLQLPDPTKCPGIDRNELNRFRVTACTVILFVIGRNFPLLIDFQRIYYSYNARGLFPTFSKVSGLPDNLIRLFLRFEIYVVFYVVSSLPVLCLMFITKSILFILELFRFLTVFHTD